MEYIAMQQDDMPDHYEPAWEKLEQATSESPFMEASFYLLREATHWLAIISSLQPLAPLTRNEAIVRGMLVRLTKLMRLTIRELSSQETFQQLSVTRDALETLATLVYLLQDDGSGERYDKYVKQSLIAERELLLDIQKNIQERGGDAWPIEERMMRSIETAARAAGIENVSALPGRTRIGYPSAEERIKLLGPNAYIVYRSGSVETHGDWNDLFRNHLSYKDGQFSPNLGSMHVRPQTPLMLTLLTLRVLIENISGAIDDQEVASAIRPKLIDLMNRASKVDELHELLLQK